VRSTNSPRRKPACEELHAQPGEGVGLVAGGSEQLGRRRVVEEAGQGPVEGGKVAREEEVQWCLGRGLRTEGVEVIRLPYRATGANSFAERWGRAVRREVLDHLGIFGRHHLARMLDEFIEHYPGLDLTKVSGGADHANRPR
jgi:hypothetical protein